MDCHQLHGVHTRDQILLVQFVEVSYKRTHLLESNDGATKSTRHLLLRELLECNHSYDLGHWHLLEGCTLYHLEPYESPPFEHKHQVHHSVLHSCPM